MMQKIFLAVASLIFTVPAIAQVDSPVIEIRAVKAARYKDGGCELTFELSNNYTSTLQVTAEVTIVDGDKTSIGSNQLYFPPALAGGKSLKVVNFRSETLAGGRCPDYFDAQVNPTGTGQDCAIVGSNAALRSEYCVKTQSFNISY